MMKYVCLTRDLFEVEDDCEQNKIKLNQEINQLTKQQKGQTVRLPDLEKQLLEEKTRKEKLEAMN